jgi:hypothetical protein
MNPEYAANLIEAITETHGQAPGTHIETAHVREEFGGQVIWEGDIEVYSINHPSGAARVYAWGVSGEDRQVSYFAVLGDGPIKTPADAVKAALLATTNRS